MKLCSCTALLVFVVAVGAYAVADNPPPQMPATKAPVQTDSTTSSKQDNGDIPPPSGASADKPRAVSPEGIAFLQRLSKNTPFGTVDFDLKGLRAGMGARQEPANKDIKLIRAKIGEIPCEWVLAPRRPKPRLDDPVGKVKSVLLAFH
ncbi:MAG: hypothetical protein H7062_03630 [Candidatus Saccharimonas sp.]|nr:hypothetical protein [Planctomycetaceae bacterium]